MLAQLLWLLDSNNNVLEHPSALYKWTTTLYNFPVSVTDTLTDTESPGFFLSIQARDASKEQRCCSNKLFNGQPLIVNVLSVVRNA